MNARRSTVADTMIHEETAVVDWQQYITVDPAILAGKPVVKGTRVGVEFVLRLFAAGWTREQVLENYPGLTPEAVSAIFALAADLLAEETWSLLPPE